MKTTELLKPLAIFRDQETHKYFDETYKDGLLFLQQKFVMN